MNLNHLGYVSIGTKGKMTSDHIISGLSGRRTRIRRSAIATFAGRMDILYKLPSTEVIVGLLVTLRNLLFLVAKPVASLQTLKAILSSSSIQYRITRKSIPR